MPHSGELQADDAEKSSLEKGWARIKAQMDWESEVVTSLSRWQIDNGLRRFAPDDNTEAQSIRANSRERQSVTQTSSGAGSVDDAAIHPFQYDVERLMKQYNTAKFYASLTDDRRVALVRGSLTLDR